MPDLEDDGFTEEAFKNLGEDPAPVTPPAADPAAPPVTPPAESPKGESGDKPKEGEEDANKDKPTGNKPDGTPESGEEKPTPGAGDKPADPAEKPGEGKPAEPATPEVPQPLTKDDVSQVVSDLLNNERTSSRELETTEKEVLDAYYPDGLSNVLVDEKSGKELRTPADVVEASGGQMSTEDATQWLMNENFKLGQQIDKIKSDARQIAETTVNFRRDSMTVLQKYEPLFKAYPTIQKKVFDKLMQQVKVDKERGVILSAPDVMDHYDFYLEPYQQAFEYANNKPATAPTPPAGGEPPKPGAEDRMDDAGDGGVSPVNDPNDFAQQVVKELAKPL